MERFSCETKLICGTGALNALKELGAKRLLVVTDPYFYENGTAQRIAELSGAAETAFFHGVQPDPSVSLAAEGTAMVRSFQPDVLVALGGGSAMDCAKAMVYFASLPVRLVAVPTTSGSGSEVTDFAILTHGGVKHPLVDGRLRPEMAILDDTLLTQLPPKLIADTGFDVLCHALEAYTATNAGFFSDVLAKEAFSTVYALLPASVGGGQQVRQRIHNASAMAGLAFTHAGLGLCHAMAHSLGGAFHLPHGRLNAILMPAVMDCNAYKAGEKYARLAQAAGVGGSAVAVGVRNLKNGLIRLRKELHMPATLAEAGIAPGRVWERSRELVQAALADPCCRTNPVPVEEFMVRKVLEEVTGRV
jgi:1-propanol dehydrogenase